MTEVILKRLAPTDAEGLECGNCRMVFSAEVNHSANEQIMGDAVTSDVAIKAFTVIAIADTTQFVCHKNTNKGMET